MTETVKLRYVAKKRGNLFWQPTAGMRALGFLALALGPDNADARARAAKLYAEWLTAKGAAPKTTDYPAGTLGEFYDRITGKFTRQPVLWWKTMSVRGREDYTRAWKHIDAWSPGDKLPALSRMVLTRITTEHCETFYEHMAGARSPSERYRTIKSLKRLLSDAYVRLKLGADAPTRNLNNPQAKGRSAFWLGAEIEIMAARAWLEGYHGLAVSIRIAWDTMFSPVDIWTATRAQLKSDATGPYLHRERAKTQAEAFGALTAPTEALLAAYLEETKVEVGRFIRQRNGEPYRSKDTFGDDFRTVRELCFPGDKRQFLDIRRSANVEADCAGADKSVMGELLANGISDSRFLDETYTPATVAKAREVHALRLEGRKKLAGEATRIRSKSPA
jgi:hypothetical protein